MKYLMTWACIVVSIQLFSDTKSESVTFRITDIRDYHVPNDAEIDEISRAFMNRVTPKWSAGKLVMPKTPDDMKLKIVRIDAPKKGKMYYEKEFRATKGCTFALERGTYRLLNDNHVLKLEERISDSTSSISTMDSIVRVPSGIGAIRDERRRCITIYRYPLNSMVSLKGRVVDESGNGLSNVRLRGIPRCIDRYDVMCHETVYATTDAAGRYEFTNLSPASFDLAVRYLLFGQVMKDSFPSEKIFEFSIATQGLRTQKSIWKRVLVPLITQNNLEGIEKTASAIRKLAAGSAMELDFAAKQGPIKNALPVSTNNVIYVGDIVLPKPKVKKE